MRKFRIAFAGLYQDDNLGDPVIARCTESMFTSTLPSDNIEIRHVSLNHYMKNQLSSRMLWWIRISNLLRIKSQKMTDWIFSTDYIRFMDEQLKDVDLVVIVGGGLIEFTGNRFTDGMYAITVAGNKYGFPVIINSVGVEGYDDNHKGCMKLKRMLHQPSVKYVSTRDDYNTLFYKYFNSKPTIICEKVADPAVWAAEIFGVSKCTDSKVVGIGIVRKDIFENYGLKFSSCQLKQLYVNIVMQLLSKGQEVHIFSNGTKADNEFAHEIQEELNKIHQIKVQLDIPLTAAELIETIAQFKGVIAGRLHSCIISYSLNIPAIGLVWNEKLSLFGKNINESGNFISPKDFDPNLVVERLNESISRGYDQKQREEFRATVRNSINSNIQKYILPNL
ncbi:polysaccharide pyruvyl transferase family protein [Prevotella sp. RM4]|uniref:polysaccharide pyruvyl transferase family protein n=1 Tax=Prevotella sp. RM4 TaxID=1200547 RepID=UPI00068D9885|nr:polysaccharide pyruvyl transferase family protein [Prevotella sp. RM4]